MPECEASACARRLPFVGHVANCLGLTQSELPRIPIMRTSLLRSSKKFAPGLDCWHHMYRCKATAHSVYEREEGVNEMQVKGITWHALTLEAEQFGATKKLLIEVFGLKPAI